MVRLGVVVLLVVSVVTACSSGGEESEYGAPVVACDLVNPATFVALAGRLGETAALPRPEATQSGTELARHWLKSDPQPRVPDLVVLGLDDGDIEQRYNGVESFTRIRAVDANVTLVIEYGGANAGAKPPGMPAAEGRDGALRLLSDAAARRPCPASGCGRDN